MRDYDFLKGDCFRLAFSVCKKGLLAPGTTRRKFQLKGRTLSNLFYAQILMTILTWEHEIRQTLIWSIGAGRPLRQEQQNKAPNWSCFYQCSADWSMHMLSPVPVKDRQWHLKGFAWGLTELPVWGQRARLYWDAWHCGLMISASSSLFEAPSCLYHC